MLMNKFLGLLAFVVMLVCLFEQNLVLGKRQKCEVCLKCLEEIKESLTPAQLKKSPLIEEGIVDWCKKQKKGTKRESFCYHVGGTDESATRILKTIADPMSMGVPNKRICENKLNKQNPICCEMNFPEQIDFSDLSKLRVKHLKKQLMDWGETCEGCLEKSEFIKKIEEVKHKYQSKNEL